MTFVSILAVFGSSGTVDKSAKFQKLFYDGLVAALGSYASDVDAVVAASAPIAGLKETESYGTALIQTLSSGAPFRALFQPELHQFQAAFEDAVAEAVDSGAAVVAVVYAGEVLHSTGEWLLADSTFSGEQLQMWLDSEAASAWQPEIQKLTSAPAGTEPINIVVCTPSAGAKTRWPMASTTDGSTHLVMLSKSRRLPVLLQTTVSWRVNGKLASSAPSNSASFEALHSLSGDLARLHWEHKSKLLAEYEQADFSLAQRSFLDAPPALYLLPSGPGGVQTQACGLLVIQGVNILLGSAFTDSKPPQWWPLVRSLDRLDAVIFPDWSASSIQSFNFLIKHLLSATSSSDAALWLGWLFAPPLIEPGSESPLLLTPPTSNADPSRIHALTTSDNKTRLFYKIGVGELSLQWLGAAVGALLTWQTIESSNKGTAPLTVFLPVTLHPETALTTSTLSPAALLAGTVRVLRKVPEICRETSGTTTPVTAKKTGVTAAPAPIKSTMRNGMVSKAKTNVSNSKHAAPASRTSTAATATAKPLASKPTNLTKPISISKTATTPASRPSTATTKPPATAAVASRTVPSRPTTASSGTSKTARPTPAARVPARPSTAVSRASTATSSVKTAKKPVAAGSISKTEAKLSEHAAKVAAKTTTSKPGHEIKYAPAGKPSNLPPRRKVGEKTVMEELNELPDSYAAPMKESHSEEPEGQVSYPDSLKAEEEHSIHECDDALNPEAATAVAKSPELKLPSLSPGMDFTLPPSPSERQEEPVHVTDPSMSPSNFSESFNELKFSPSADDELQRKDMGMTKSPEMEFGGAKTHTIEESQVMHEEFNFPKSPVGTQIAMSLGHEIEPEMPRSSMEGSHSPLHEEFAEHHEDLEVAKSPYSKSPSGEELAKEPLGVALNIPSGNLDELVISKSSPEVLHEDAISRSPTDMEFTMPPEHQEVIELSETPIETLNHDVLEHQEDRDEQNSLPHDKIEKSLTEMDFGFSKSPENLNYEVLDDSKCTMQEEVSPAGMQFSVPPAHPSEFDLSKPTAEVKEDLKVPFHEEIPQTQASTKYSMPPGQHSEDSTSSNSPQHEVPGLHEETGISRLPFEDEVLTSPLKMDFSSPADHSDELELSKLSTEVLHHDVLEYHCKESEVAKSPSNTEIAKSPAGMAYTVPLGDSEHLNDLELSQSPAELLKEPETAESPLRGESSKSPGGMQDEFSVSRSPPEVYHEESGELEFAVRDGIPNSPDVVDPQLDVSEHLEETSKPPTFLQEHDEEVGLSKSPPQDISDFHSAPVTSETPDIGSKNSFLQESFGFNAHQVTGIHSGPFESPSAPVDPSELSESPSEVQFSTSHGSEEHKDLGSVNSPEEKHPHGNLELLNRPQTPLSDAEYNGSVASPATKVDIIGHHHIEAAAARVPNGSDLDYRIHHVDDEAFLRSYASAETQALDRSPEAGFRDQFQPTATSTTEEEYPVHEMNLGGGKAIPEVSDHVDSVEVTSANMPPIHSELLYESESDRTAHPADSTTTEAPNVPTTSPEIGFMGLKSLMKLPEENVYSPDSEVSNDSVIHTATEKPTAPGFIPELVSSTSPSGPKMSSSPTSGFSSEHPFLYTQHTPDAESSESVEHVITTETDAILNQKLSPISSELPAFNLGSPQEHGANGLLETGDFTNGTEKAADSSTGAAGSSAVFDPLLQWGQPQGMPAPVLPTRGSTALARAPRPVTAPSAKNSSVGARASASASTSSKAPETLPPGPPVLMDVVWVPGYIIRVPFTMAAQFFTQVRARVYILSGECLHPITGEAIIAGVSKWSSEEREAVCKLSGGRGVEGINVVPTDEPLDWVRWLRRSAGGDGKGGTGEERLKAVGLNIHSSATLCDIHFSDNGSEITCPGTQLMI